MMKIAVLVSGGGTNLQAILESERRGENPNGKVTLVVASKPGVYALNALQTSAWKPPWCAARITPPARSLTLPC